MRSSCLGFFFFLIVFSELSMNSAGRAVCTPPPQPLPLSFPPTSKSWLVTYAPPLHNYRTIMHMHPSFLKKKMCFSMDDTYAWWRCFMAFFFSKKLKRHLFSFFFFTLLSDPLLSLSLCMVCSKLHASEKYISIFCFAQQAFSENESMRDGDENVCVWII